MTLDLGVRFSHIGVVYERDRDIGWFDPTAWNPARAVQLWQPHCANGVFPCTGANRVARNPITGEQRASPWIGAIVAGSGDINNGTVFGKEIPDTFPSAGIKTAPRLGFGWDVFGDGKTAVRGGFGTSYNRLGDGQYGGFTGVISRTVNLQWTTIDDRFNAPSLENPLGGTMVQDETRPITVHSWSVGVQRELPWRLLADVAYVGNSVRNAFAVNAGQSYTNQLNDPDPRLVANPHAEHDRSDDRQRAADQLHPSQLSRAAARSPSASSWTRCTGTTTRSSSRSAGAWRMGSPGRRTTPGSVTKQYTAYDWYRTPEDNETRNTHNNGGRPHNAEVHLQLDAAGSEPVPRRQRHRQGACSTAGSCRGSRPCWAGPGRTFALHLLSVAAHRAPTSLTGGLGGSRAIIVCDPNLPRSERTFERQYRTECVRPPGPLTDPTDTLYQGTGVGAGQEDARMGLGYINHDLTLMKNFSLGGGRNLQVRAEVYNAFNTTQYQGVNTTATFDFATGVQTNPAFGSISGVRANSNRVIQLGVRLTF